MPKKKIRKSFTFFDFQITKDYIPIYFYILFQYFPQFYDTELNQSNRIFQFQFEKLLHFSKGNRIENRIENPYFSIFKFSMIIARKSSNNQRLHFHLFLHFIPIFSIIILYYFYIIFFYIYILFLLLFYSIIFYFIILFHYSNIPNFMILKLVKQNLPFVLRKNAWK